MKRALVPLLVCPTCQNILEVSADQTDDNEIIEGALSCSSCGSVFPIIRGIARFLAQSLTEDQKATADAFGYEWTRYSKLTGR